jgi:hypothetical protein
MKRNSDAALSFTISKMKENIKCSDELQELTAKSAQLMIFIMNARLFTILSVISVSENFQML